MRCKNCGKEFEGSYCPECGQSAKVKRLTVATLFEGLASALFSFDRGIWKTLWDMFTRPGFMIADYIHGKRARYINPFSLLVILTTIFLLEAHVLGIDTSKKFLELKNPEIELGTAEVNTMDVQDRIYKLFDFFKENSYVQTVRNWVSGNKLFFIIISVPLYALAMRHSFRRRKKHPAIGAQKKRDYNYAECLCAMSFFASQLLCVSMVSMPFRKESGITINGFNDVGFVATLVFLIWDLTQMYHISRRRALAKSILLYIWLWTFYMIIGTLVIVGLWLFSGIL